MNKLNIIIVTLLFSSCQKDNSMPYFQGDVRVAPIPKYQHDKRVTCTNWPKYDDKEEYLALADRLRKDLLKLAKQLDDENEYSSTHVQVCLMGEQEANGGFRLTGSSKPHPIALLSKNELKSLSKAEVIYDDAKWNGMSTFNTTTYYAEALVSSYEIPLNISINARNPNRVYVANLSSDSMRVAFQAPELYNKIRKGLLNFVPLEDPPR